jgi:hypothetical protein
MGCFTLEMPGDPDTRGNATPAMRKRYWRRRLNT